MRRLMLMVAFALLRLLEMAVRVVFAGLLLLLVAVAIIAALARNEAATQAVLQEVVPIFVPDLILGDNQGGILSPNFSLDRISYSDQAGSQLEIGRIKLEWNPAELWAKRVTIQRLDIASIDYQQGDASDSEEAQASEPFQLPDIELPIEVSIERLDIHRVVITAATTSEEPVAPIELSGIHLSVHAAQSAIALSDVTAAFQQQSLTVQSRASVVVETQGEWPIDAELDGSLNGLPLGESPTGIDSKLAYKLRLKQSLRQLSVAGELSSDNGVVSIEADLSPFDSRLPMQLAISSESFVLDSPDISFNSKLDLKVAGNIADGFEISGPVEVNTTLPYLASYRVEGLKASVSSTDLVLSKLELGIQLDNLAEQRLIMSGNSTLVAPFKANLKAQSADVADKLTANLAVKWDGDTDHLPSGSFALSIPNLSHWAANATGVVELNADLSTTALGQPNLRSTGLVRNFVWDDHRIAQANLKANLSLQAKGTAVANLTIADANLAGQQINTVALTLSGTTDEHQLVAKVDSVIAKLDSEYSGGLRFSQGGVVQSWSGRVAKLQVDHAQAGRLLIDTPVELTVSKTSMALSKTCLQLDSIKKASLCASGELLQNGDITASISQLELPLESVSAYVKGLNSTGLLRGQGVVSGNINQPDSVSAKLQMSIGEGGLAQAASAKNAEIPLFSFSKGDVFLSYKQQGLNAGFELQESNGGYLKASANSQFRLKQLSEWQGIPLSAEVDADKLPIDWLKQGLPDVRELNGELKINLQAAGTLGEPIPMGQVIASGDKLTVPLAGLSVEKWGLTVEPNGDAIKASLKAVADDGGTLNASLMGSWKNGGDFNGNVKGSGFPLYQTPDAQIWADPNINLRFAKQRLDVSGRVDVNRANIAPSISLKSSGSKISVSEDQVMVDDSGEAVEEGGGIAINADVTIAFGQDVNIKAYGLETKLGGKLQVIETPGRLTRARGEIKLVDGQYAAFGQPLKISRGALLFQNTLLTQPALDVTAVREFDDVTVGVNARGTIEKPELELFSSPALSQSDQLSWLVLGRPFDRQSSDQDSDNALARATRALQLQGAEFLTGKLSQRLGIEDVALESTDDGSGSALVLGKYLSPRLYLSYGLGLFDARNQLKLKYQIGSNWAFEAASDGIDSGGDILYQREK